MHMVVGVVRVDLRFHEVHSLKDKRSRIARLLNRLRSHLPISVAEVGWQNLHQRCLIGVSVCCGTESQARSMFARMEEEIMASGLAEVVDLDFEYLHYGEEIR
ncbi:MAG: DUF503 domain-containing protein [Desulfuromonas sp.]|nr:MAG: DUF503 domain-containing protein [Desulfuromonas sp.]